jgi:hypothetical protein
MLGNLFSKIMGFILIIVTLALAPSIVTTNAAVAAHANVTSGVLIGMSVIAAFGAPLIILGLLVMGGVFAVAGVKGQINASAGDLMKVVGATIVAIVALTFMSTICTYVANLMGYYTLGTEFARTIFAIIPLVIYLGIIVSTGWAVGSTYKKVKG